MPHYDRTVSGAILEAAKASGINRLWFASGSDLVAFQEHAAAAKSLGMLSPEIMTVTHEHVGLSMAMGEHMVSGAPVAVAAHADLGLLNFGGAIHNASVGGYPVLIISGYPATSRAERTSKVFWYQQKSDLGQIVREYTKWDYKLTAHDNPREVTARAIQVALTPRQGPSYLTVPMEVSLLAAADASASRVRSAQDLGIGSLGVPSIAQVEEIAEELLRAKKPLIITDRLGWDKDAVPLLADLAREFAIGVEASRHRMNLADDHPAGHSGISVGAADAILVLEQDVPWIPAVAEPSEGAFVAVVGSDAITSRIPVYEFAAKQRIQADVGSFLILLREAMRSLRKGRQKDERDRRWRRFTDRARQALLDRSRRQEVALTRTVPSIDAIAGAVNSVLDPHDVLTWELAETNGISRTAPGTLFDKGASSLGWAVAAATGARITDRSRPSVCVTGDGSYQFGVPDALLWSQQQYDSPVLTVIVNNRGYRTGTSTLVERFPSGYSTLGADYSGGSFDPPPDFAAQANAAGGYGRKVMDARELREAMVEARRAVEEERRPAVVDVWVPAHVTGAHPLSKAKE